MKITDLRNFKGNVLNSKLEAKKIPLSFSTQMVNLILQPEGELPLHKTPVDVLFYVIKGKGILTIGDEKKEVEEGSVIESPANIDHGWENKSNEELSILVIKLF